MPPKTKKPFSWKKWLFLFSLAGWIWVILMINPIDLGLKAWLVFYGLLGLVFYNGVGWLGAGSSRQEDGTTVDNRVRRHLNRWGILTAVFVIGLLLLQQFHILLWWVGLLWLAFLLLVELIFYQSES